MSDINLDLEKEFSCLKNSYDPEPDISIHYIFVLSGFNTYLKKTCHVKSENIADDFDRMQLGIDMAKKIVSLKADVNVKDLTIDLLKKYGPKIVYNGSEDQNTELTFALDNHMIDYPKELFIILPIPSNMTNTKQQFISFKTALPLADESIGFITHAYHYPRIARMLNPQSPLYPFGPHMRIYAFLVDRELKSAGILQHIENEMNKIPLYVTQGDLTKQQSNDINSGFKKNKKF